MCFILKAENREKLEGFLKHTYNTLVQRTSCGILEGLPWSVIHWPLPVMWFSSQVLSLCLAMHIRGAW